MNTFQLQSKLDRIRDDRNKLMLQVDILVNDVALGDSVHSAESVKIYRQALKDVTEPFKHFETVPEQAAALEALDLSEFSWPVLGG